MIRGRKQLLLDMRLEQVEETIRNHGVVMPKQIVAETGLSDGYVSDILCRLINTGRIQRVKAGYRLLAS